VLAIIRVGLFFGDKIFVKKQVDRANMLVESGGDWDRRNRLKAYKGLHLLTIRSYGLAAPFLLDSLSTFTSYELCTYSSLVTYAVLAGSLSHKRVDFKADASSGPSGQASTVVNLATLGTGSGAQAVAEKPVDFSPLSSLVNSLYNGDYRAYFVSLAAVEDNFLSCDRYLFEHRAWFVREMRLRGYQQLLQSYRVVGLETMAANFGVTVDFLDRFVMRQLPIAEPVRQRKPSLVFCWLTLLLTSSCRDLAKFIAGDRISCTIDRVRGIIETTRPDDKNKQYADVVKHGDGLITKLQKYGQSVRLRGSERA
jgi:26S proteasome regulatory subunit N7